MITIINTIGYIALNYCKYYYEKSKIIGFITEIYGCYAKNEIAKLFKWIGSCRPFSLLPELFNFSTSVKHDDVIPLIKSNETLIKSLIEALKSTEALIKTSIETLTKSVKEEIKIIKDTLKNNENVLSKNNNNIIYESSGNYNLIRVLFFVFIIIFIIILLMVIFILLFNKNKKNK